MLKQIASFVKLEHTLFSLPFVFIGAFLAHDSGYEVGLQDLFWILIAAVGARGLAMTPTELSIEGLILEGTQST